MPTLPVRELTVRTNLHDSKGAPKLPKRWIVECSFAWLENFRRLTIDYASRKLFVTQGTLSLQIMQLEGSAPRPSTVLNI